MSDLLTQYTPLILDCMVVAILACGVAIRMHKGLYDSLMPLAVILASALCGVVLSMVLTEPLAERAVPAVKDAILSYYDYSVLTVREYDAMLKGLEKGMTEEMRQTLRLSYLADPAKEAARDAGSALARVNDEVLTDENIDSAVSGVEDGLSGIADEVLKERLKKAAREALEERGLTGDAAREYIRKAGDLVGSAGETVLTDENVDAVLNAVQKELDQGAAGLLGDGSEARAGRAAVAAAGEDRRAATEAAVGALVGFLAPRYIRVVVFLVGWVAFLAILTTIKNTFGLAFKLPVIKHADKLGGAVLGFVEYAALIWLALWLVRYLGFNVFQELAKDTLVLRFFT